MRVRRRRPIRAVAVLAAVALGTAACGSSGTDDGEAATDDTPSEGDAGEEGDGGEAEAVTLELAQWWEPELPDGAFRELIDGFEEANPGVTVELLSGPYASTRDQLFAAAATDTLPDVVGLDGAWVNDFSSQGVIADMGPLMDDAGFDRAELAATVEVDGAIAMIPVVNFIYPLFTNDELLAEAGIESPPSTREEFRAAANALAELDGNVSGWVLPLSLEAPNGIQNDVMSWAWASGDSMLADGQPALTDDGVSSAIAFVKSLWDDGVIAPGALTMTEQDKVEEFTNGRVGMMVDTLSHINLIRESNEDLAFSVAPLPAADGYDGPRGLPYASWGIGVSASTEHPEEAWALVQHLMSVEVNSQLSTIANAFPGNVGSEPDLSGSDPLFADAFEIYQEATPVNEFVGLPVAEQLMREFDEQLQLFLTDEQSLDDTLQAAQDAWQSSFDG